MMQSLRFLALITLFGVLACQPQETSESSEASEPAAAPKSFSDEDVAANKALSQKWVEAVLAKDWEAFGAIYTESAVLLPPHSPIIEGRTAIQNFFKEFPPLTAIDLKVSEVGGDGDMAHVIGTYTLTISPEGADPIDDAGKFLEFRERQADGTWLISADQFNSDVPLPGQEQKPAS